MNTIISKYWILSAVIALVPTSGLYANDAPHQQVAAATERKASPVKNDAKGTPRLAAIAANKVCMVNDRVFPTPQIPVEVEGRTYYGCCEGCKATLANDRRARMAVDPVSGREVDKAKASIGAFPDGRVAYFESAKNRAAFNPEIAK
jgi:YHS domain-containing protein